MCIKTLPLLSDHRDLRQRGRRQVLALLLALPAAPPVPGQPRGQGRDVQGQRPRGRRPRGLRAQRGGRRHQEGRQKVRGARQPGMDLNFSICTRLDNVWPVSL